jgi:TetR/AcrR family transcriptional regulator, tetracycline repressor protein
VSPRPRRSYNEQAAAVRRGPEQPLSRERIVKAALALVDEEGLAALSMRRLAAALGVDPMAIYYYLPNKSALEDAIVEAVVADVEDPGFQAKPTLYQFILSAGRAYRAALLRHPRALPLVVNRNLQTPSSLKVADNMLGLFVEEGMTAPEGVATLNIFATYVEGAALRESLRPQQPQVEDHDGLRQMQDMLPPDEFPNLTRAMAGGKMMNPEEEFEFGLEALAQGLSDLAKHQPV